MFYEPKNGHGLPHSPFNAIVAPRPIGWISTRGPLGDNLAPYSFFNAIAYDPPQVMFAGDLKDSIRNIQDTGVFAVSVVPEALLQEMNASSAPLPRGTDEFDHAGVEKAECVTINCPRVALSPATLECRMTQVITLGGPDNLMVIGEVTGVHLRDDCLTNGKFDISTFGLVARLGYKDYATLRNTFAMNRPEGA